MNGEIKIIRQRRKTIGLYILPDCTVEVRCPGWMHTEQILAFADSKKEWIEKQIDRKQREKQRREAFVLSWESKVSYLGKDYPVRQTDGQAQFDGEAFYIPQGTQIKEALICLYREMAKEVLPRKTEYFSRQMGCAPRRVGITSARTRWGSCSGQGNINFSWRLMMAPEPAVDYVVIHELAHLFQLNHSSVFWEKVRAFCPDYEERKRQLYETQKKICREGW